MLSRGVSLAALLFKGRESRGVDFGPLPTLDSFLSTPFAAARQNRLKAASVIRT
jgi:hypothetical protein